MAKYITIHDIAKELEIDSSTVSRALNNNPRVGKKTKEKVLKAAEDMGYQRNMLASNLRQRKTMTIGIVVPYISRDFLSKTIDGIEQIIGDNNYSVIISQTRDDFEKEKKIVDGLFRNRIDGLLISPSIDFVDDEYLGLFKKNNIPVVFFDRYIKSSNLPKVVIDDSKAAFDITEHVIKLGAKKLLHLSGNLNSAIYQERAIGFNKAIKHYNLDETLQNISSINLLPEKAIQKVKNLIEKNDLPDAIICSNDVTALAIIKYFSDTTNIVVGKDILITGFSNEKSAQFISPGLTTVDQNPIEMGRQAANLLFEAIESNENRVTNKTIIIDSELVIRESSVHIGDVEFSELYELAV